MMCFSILHILQVWVFIYFIMFLLKKNFIWKSLFLINEQCKEQNSISSKTKNKKDNKVTKEKKYELIKRRTLVRKQNELNKEIK